MTGTLCVKNFQQYRVSRGLLLVKCTVQHTIHFQYKTDQKILELNLYYVNNYLYKKFNMYSLLLNDID